MAKGCEWPEGCDLPNVPIYHVTKIDSDEIDGDYCRVHGYKRIRQLGRERRAAQEPEPRAALEYEPPSFVPASGSIMDAEFDELISPPREPFQGQ